MLEYKDVLYRCIPTNISTLGRVLSQTPEFLSNRTQPFIFICDAIRKY